MRQGAQENVHASCVALDAETGLLIIGPSGSGKSTLALQLMSLGAHLVSDDRTVLDRTSGTDDLTAEAPPPLKGMIEARGLGLLAATALPHCRIKAVVDMGKTETERLPPRRETGLMDVSIPLFYRVEGPHFAPALLQWLKGGRCA